MRNFVLTILSIFLIVSISQGIEVNENFLKYKGAQIDGAGNCYWMITGQDTLAPDGADSTGYDSLVTTGILQVQWVAGDAGTYPNLSISDSLVIHGGDMVYLWVEMDTTGFSHTDSSYWDYTVTAPDTVGFEFIVIRYYMDNTEDPAWRGDTLNIFVFDGGWNSDQYGVYHFEEQILPVATAGAIDRWWVYRVPIAPCAYCEIEIHSADNILETPIIKWKLVVIKGGK